MKQMVIVDEKNRFEYSVSWDDKVLADLDVDEANVYFCVSNASRYLSGRSFAAVLTVRGQQKGIVISGVINEKGTTRPDLRAFLILLNELKKHAEKFRGNIYLNNFFLWKIINRGWCSKWMDNGYLKNDGRSVMNKDLIVPITEYFYKDRRWYHMGKLEDYRELDSKQDNNLRYALKKINYLVYGNAG